MNTRPFFSRPLLVWSILLLAAIFPALAAEPNANAGPAESSSPELGDLRQQLDTIQRSNQEASEKWAGLMKQNSALSNRLAGLHQSFLSQQERELEIQKQSNSFNLKVMGGAAAAVFLVILLSFWFQLRCFNRALELSRALPGLPAHAPALLENENSPGGAKLLGAVKLLENRIQQLEMPAPSPVSSNGTSGDSTAARNLPGSVNLLNAGFVENNPGSSNVSLLLAKGQMLLDMDRLQEAVSSFQEALTIDASNEEAHLKKGLALERLNRLDLSLTAYDEALRLNPKRTVAYLYKARVLQGLHRYDEALSVYESALSRKSAPKPGPGSLAI